MSIASATTPHKNFGLWARLSLTIKLLGAFGLVFLLALLIAGVNLYGLRSVQAQYENTLNQGVEIRRLSSLLEVSLLQARRAEKNFQLRYTTEGYDTAYDNYIPQFNTNIASMRDYINQLEEFGPTAAELSSETYSQDDFDFDIVNLRRYVFIYEQLFFKQVEVYRQRGYDENSGYEGEFRKYATEMEEQIVGQAGLETLEIQYLSMRRAEKDYLARGESQYSEQVNIEYIHLKEVIESHENLTLTQKNSLKESLEKYITTFNALVELDKLIAVYDTELIAAARAVEPLAQNLFELGQQAGASSTLQAQTTSSQITAAVIITVIVVLLFTIFLSITIARQLTRPIISLTNTAQEIAGGDFASLATVTSADEIGVLANTFNDMTSRLRQSLEAINRRAAQLATVAQVSTNTSTIQDPARMLETAVRLTQRGFSLYHAHVFSYRPERDELQIEACGYKEGDEHEGNHGTTTISVQQQQSLVARAARTRKPVIVNDVRSDPGWLPNPVLPDTRAELAVPMVVGEELVGVLDVQSEMVDAFTDEDANIQMTLAAQIAVALKNAQSYTAAQEQAQLESLVNTIGQKIQRAGTIEDTLQIAARELGLALGAARVQAHIEQPEKDASLPALS